MSGPHSAAEINDARDHWILVTQDVAFRIGDGCYSRRKTRSLLCRLNPFIDARGFLRVRERIKNSVLSPDQRHLVLLPKNSHFTNLLIGAHHHRTLHGGEGETREN